VRLSDLSRSSIAIESGGHMKEVKRIALYSRVSTADQDTEVQMKALREYARNRGLEITGQYVDQGVSGTKKSRPQLDSLMKDAHARKFDAVVVYRFDRFARSIAHLVNALETFRALGIQFTSINEAIDTATPHGEAFFGMIAVMAQLERSLILARSRDGIALMKATGKTRSGRPTGRPRRVFDREEARTLHRQGHSNRKIAAMLGVGKDTVRLAVQQM
jgi:DNA invertase Pin-like site-specific DNA recombinase